ncbi:MAG: sporulation protein [Faecalibacterium sp.]|jgi:sporulation protein YabP|nr:sporulation protein [Faecalibacterium sp.]
MEKKAENTRPAPEKAMPHNLILEDRKRLTATGVLRMISCDENGATMETGRGLLSITGRELSVSTLSLETGEVHFSGQVDEIVYTETHASAGGFWHRLTR